MPTDLLNTGGDLHFVYPRWQTVLSTGSSPPSDSVAPSDVLQATKVVQSAGGAALDYADLSWKVLAPLTNRTQPASFQRMVSVGFFATETYTNPDTVVGDFDFRGGPQLHLGDYISETEQVNKSGESLTAQSQLRSYHFGDPFEGQRWFDPLSEDSIVIEVPAVFNPRIDGKIRPNRSDIKLLNAVDSTHYLWIHPEAALTADSQAANGQVPESWTLQEAVFSIIEECNQNKEFIRNPTREDLDILASAPTLEDVKLPIGKHLPFYLDKLLQPLGFNWYVAQGEVVEGIREQPTIKVFEKGVGTAKTLYFQAPGSVLSKAESNCNDYRVSRRIGDSVNSVRVLGAPERAEVTLELVKAWPESDDSLIGTDLDKSNSNSKYKGKENVWRLWCANEAGDYTGTRPEITDAPDLSTVFTKYVPHRRNIEDPFTYLSGGERRERQLKLLEYSVDDGTTWNLVDNTFGPSVIMPDQIGVLFTGNRPPEALIGAGANAKVRITGVVVGDTRLIGEAPRRPEAVNGRDVTLVLDVPRKFRNNWVQEDGDFKSALLPVDDDGNFDPAGADVAEEYDEIKAYAEKVRDSHEVAEISCSFTLPGIHTEYEIGDLITKINGREISLNQASVAGTPRYVQVVKREWRSDPPTTILTVDRGAKT